MALASLAVNDDLGADLTSLITIPVNEGATYHIAADGYAGASGNLILNLFFAGGGSASSASPVSPARAGARAISPRKIRLTWDPGANATGYLIEKRDPGSKRWRKVKTVSAATFSASISGLNSDGVYQFRVTALYGSLKAPSPSRIVRVRPK